MANAIRANQHPTDCAKARYLLVEDDMLQQGLGFSARQHRSTSLPSTLH